MPTENNMKYRIVKKHDKDYHTQEPEHWYVIERQHKTIFGRTKWKVLQRQCYAIMDVYYMVITFSKLVEAKKYLKNLKALTPKDKIVCSK